MDSTLATGAGHMSNTPNRHVCSTGRSKFPLFTLVSCHAVSHFSMLIYVAFLCDSVTGCEDVKRESDKEKERKERKREKEKERKKERMNE